MKAQLTFDLTDEEGKFEYEMHNKLHSYVAVLGEMRNYLRNKVKYGDRTNREKEFDVFEEVYAQFGESCALHNLDFWEDF